MAGKVRQHTATLAPGEQWLWKRELRGGSGYVIPVPVVIVCGGAKRVKVEAPLKTGGFRLVWIAPESLVKPRKEE